MADEARACGLATDIVEPDAWPAAAFRLGQRAVALSANAVTDMLSLTRGEDTRDADLAALVNSAGRSGLRQRIEAYRDRVRRLRRHAPASPRVPG